MYYRHLFRILFVRLVVVTWLRIFGLDAFSESMIITGFEPDATIFPDVSQLMELNPLKLAYTLYFLLRFLIENKVVNGLFAIMAKN